MYRFPTLSLAHRLAPCCAAAALTLLAACAGPGQPNGAAANVPPELAAQTPERVNATPADYRGNDCDMLARFLPLMQHAQRVTAGFQRTVYGWHAAAIEQVQREKNCRDGRVNTAARSVTAGQLGIRVDAVTPALAHSLGLDAARGALVLGADAGSAAARAGLQPRDVIVEVDGQRVQSPAELASIVSLMAPGTRAPLAVWRQGVLTRLTIDVMAASEPASVAQGATPNATH